MASEALGSATPSAVDDDVRKAVHTVSGAARRKYLGIPDDITAKIVAWDEFTPTECQQAKTWRGQWSARAKVLAGIVRFVLVRISSDEHVLLRIFSGLDGTHALEGLVADATCVRVIEAGEFVAKSDES